MRQPASPARGESRPPTMPLMPRMRPLNRMKTAAARPSTRPPARDAQGVKWVQSMVMALAYSFVFALDAVRARPLAAAGLQYWAYRVWMTATASSLASE